MVNWEVLNEEEKFTTNNFSLAKSQIFVDLFV